MRRIVLCLIASFCTAASVRAQAAPPLVVQVIDCAQVPVSVMRVAEHAVTQAFLSVGVRALWREGSERAMPFRASRDRRDSVEGHVAAEDDEGRDAGQRARHRRARGAARLGLP